MEITLNLIEQLKNQFKLLTPIYLSLLQVRVELVKRIFLKLFISILIENMQNILQLTVEQFLRGQLILNYLGMKKEHLQELQQTGVVILK